MTTIPPPTDILMRYHRLQRLNLRIDAELVALGNALRVAGLMPAGRPRIKNAFSHDEARAAHARYRRGLRDDETMLGERQYQREWRRAARRRRAS